VLNPWVRSEASLARTHVRHYYARRLREREFWSKLLSGRIGVQAWRGLAANLRARQTLEPGRNASYQERMARAWASFDGHVLLVLSGDDYTAKEFVEVAQRDPAWAGALCHARLQRLDLAVADHTFSCELWRWQVNEATVQFIRSLCKQQQRSIEEAA
jgi:hypothetical protein